MRKSTRVSCSGIMIMTCLILMIVCTCSQYTHKKTLTATVYSITPQQCVSSIDSKVYTSYKYLVGTDKGTMQIKPNGIMSSIAFGQLKEGKTYRLHTRGYAFPLIGMYPYIVNAEEE